MVDLDSNTDCSLDNVKNENIVWPVGQAPQATYTVRVDYWISCSVAATEYTVLVNKGGDVEVFSRRFTGFGDRGGAGSGINITTFDRTSVLVPIQLRVLSMPVHSYYQALDTHIVGSGDHRTAVDPCSACIGPGGSSFPLTIVLARASSSFAPVAALERSISFTG